MDVEVAAPPVLPASVAGVEAKDMGEGGEVPPVSERESTEFRAKAQRMADARAAMADEDRLQCESAAALLRPNFCCSHCHDVFLEPWIVKDCGHLYCYECLYNLVDQKVLPFTASE